MRAEWFRRLRRLATDDGGPTTAEYALMLALLLGTILLAVAGLGRTSRESWQDSVGSINKAAGR